MTSKDIKLGMIFKETINYQFSGDIEVNYVLIDKVNKRNLWYFIKNVDDYKYCIYKDVVDLYLVSQDLRSTEGWNGEVVWELVDPKLAKLIELRGWK